MKILSTLVLFTITIASAHAADCTNYSGNWAGTCTVDGETRVEQDKMVLDQKGCEAIVYEKQMYEFGKTFVKHDHAEGNESVTKVTPFWSSTQTDFYLNYSVDGTFVQGLKIEYAVNGAISFAMNDGKITSVNAATTTRKVAGGPPETSSFRRRCSYVKQ